MPAPMNSRCWSKWNRQTSRSSRKTAGGLGRVDIGFVLRDAEGKSYQAENDTIDLNLTRESYGKLQETGILYHKRFPRPEKAMFLRIAGRDGASGLAGSLTIPLKNVESYTPKQPAR